MYNLITETIKTYNLTYHNYQYLIVITILNLLMILKTTVLTRLMTTLMTVILMRTVPRQQKFRAMNGAHLASPIRGELGYAHWPQLGTQFIALLGTKFGAH